MKNAKRQNTKECIEHEADNKEAWKCLCGNTPCDSGFYPCDTHGNEVEPTPEDWEEDLYVCAECGRIIHQDTLEVVGRNPHFKLLL